MNISCNMGSVQHVAFCKSPVPWHMLQGVTVPSALCPLDAGDPDTQYIP